jgi:ribosomal protein L11 methyltransferase
VDPSPALVLHFSTATTAGDRERLVALFADFGLVAIQEDDVAAPTVWVAHFATAESRDAAREAAEALADVRSVRFESTEVPDDNWAARTQADLPAIRIGRVIVAPPWDLPKAAEAGTIVVEIEPSRGFGTGHHQSTRLCLALLQSRELSARTVTDVGTGSGVLAIAAARLGAARVTAIDVDPDAVENARENIARNQVAPIVDAHVRDLTDPSLPTADVVTANLTGALLARHAGALGALVRPGGALIVAGFTADERDRVAEAFAPEYAVSEAAEEEGWYAFVLVTSARTP